MALKKIHETKLFLKIKAFTKRHEKLWIPLMLVGGLSGDIIQFSALNIYEKFAIMGVYVIVSMSALIFIHYPHPEGFRRLRLAAPFMHQFAVGGLLSTSLLFYWFSGDISVSWPLILIVAIFMLSNEFLRVHFLRPTVQIGVLSFSLFSLSAILFSFLFNSLDPKVFVEAGAASLAFMLVFVVVLVYVDHLKARLGAMLTTIVVVFALMNACYFLNIIPPIPLSLREAGIYHNVSREGGEYIFTGESETWWQKIFPGQTVHTTSADTLYAYTAIFAPTDLSTTIVHEWQYFDESMKSWVTKADLSFSITGGRDQGYRGYSTKSHLTPGKWRVNVETTRGQVLGRIKFTVVGL